MINTGSIEVPFNFGEDDLVPILFYVKGKQLLDAQAAVQQFLAGSPAQATDGPYKPPFSNTHGPKDAWELPRWTGENRDAAEWIVSVIGTNQLKVLANLVAAGPDGVWTGELRHNSGYDGATSMSGVFKAIGGRFRSVGLRPIWNGGEKDTQKGQRLSVPDGPARQVFMDALKAKHPDVAEDVGIG
jgi:hypothetical protein